MRVKLICKRISLTWFVFLIVALFLTSQSPKGIDNHTDNYPQGSVGAKTWELTPIPGDEYDFRAYYNGTAANPSNENIIQVTRYYSSINEYICYLSWNLTDFRNKGSLDFTEAFLWLDYHSNDYWDTSDDIDIKLKNLDTGLDTPIANISALDLTLIYHSDANASLINIDVDYSAVSLDVLPLIQYWYENGTDNWITLELSPSEDNPISSGYETIKWEDSHHYPGNDDDPKLSISAEIVFPEPLHDWYYRKKHTILPAAGAGTNYQVRFNVHYGAGLDSEGNVFLDGQCQADFDDIRFTLSDGKTELDYWIEENNPSENATIWVEITADLSSLTQVLYLYYGNLEVSTTSNGTNTFLLFDDFEDGIKDSQWDSGGNPNESGGELTCTGIQPEYYQSSSTFLYAAAMARLSVDGTGTSASSYFGFNPDTMAGVFPSEMFYFDNDEDDPQHRLWSGTSADAEYTNISQVETETTYQVLWNKSMAHFIRNEELLDTHTTYIANSAMPIILASYHASGTITFEWVSVRNYIYPEPTLGDWRAQEINTEPGVPSQKLPEHYLRMNDTTDRYLYYYLNNSVSRTNGVTVEARARLVTDLIGTYGPLGLYIQDGTHCFIVSVGSDFVKVDYNNLQKFIWTDEGTFNGSMWHTYRLTAKEGILYVYVDGLPIGGPWTTQRTDYFNHLRFGCLWSRTYQAIIDWDYVRVAQDEETAPPMIPEWNIILDMSSSPSKYNWAAIVGDGNKISLPFGSNDLTPPSIDNPPPNIVLSEGESDLIEWTAFDAHPAGYVIYKDGIVQETNFWDGSLVSHSIEGLGIGVYDYTIEFYDEFGNGGADVVLVTIEPVTFTTTQASTTPTTTSSPPIDTTSTTNFTTDVNPVISPGFSLPIMILVAVCASFLYRKNSSK